MEEEPRKIHPESPENNETKAELTVAELIDIFSDKLDPEADIPFMEGMDIDEAKDYVMSALLSSGEEDPEGLMVERGVAESFQNSPELQEIVKRPSTTGEEYSTEEADAAARRAAEAKKE